MTNAVPVGRVVALWRYPVKSMAGEGLDAVELTARGLLGDRGYAVVDEAAGLVASAKSPRLWPDLMNYRAAFLAPPRAGEPLPPVRITLPDGRAFDGDGPANDALSAAFGRRVVLTDRPPAGAAFQMVTPDLDDTGAAEPVDDYAMPPGTFFDLAAVNVLLTTTLDRLGREYPAGQFVVPRFRPNVVIAPEGDDPEAAWAGRLLTLGDAARLRVDSRCGRCVMTTLAQADLPRDAGILRTVVRSNDGFAGLNTSVAATGVIRVGDHVWLDAATG